MALTEVRKGQRITYRSGDAEIIAYLSQPTTPGTHPGMVVIQPVHGLTPYLEIVADHLADQGYVAIAPALYSRLGTITTDSSSGVPPEARALSNQTPDPQVVADLRAAIDYLQGLPSVGTQQKIGGCGFCAGGRHGLFLMAAEPRVAAFVAFYPTVTDEQPQPHRPTLVWDVIKDIRGSVCVLIGDRDEPTVEKYRERLRKALEEHGIDYEYHLYGGGLHGFSNGGSDHYQEHIARAAWAVADDYLARKLKG
ncbi:MAG TPA: dienelactone hydrolase family protein [Chloroflexota bacterium]|jgi:carboxymethylenebutenolidase|nr:dienelactone hydrolase family protein [Chloroflexota bacterium]